MRVTLPHFFALAVLTLLLCGCSRNAMLAAAKKGDTKKVKRLLAKDPALADVCEIFAQGRSALTLATVNGHAEVVAALLEAGAKTNYSHLMELAARHGHIPVMEMLLKKGFSVHGDQFYSPLLSAAGGQPASVEFLLAHGADINEQDNQRNGGCAALHYAALYGNPTMVTTLLAHGANIEIKNNDGWTPLFHAAASGEIKTVEALLVKSANVNARSGRGWTPLMRAIANGHDNVMPILLAHGIDVNARNDEQDTALTLAVKETYNPYAVSDAALSKANEKKCLQMVTLLLKHKADPTMRNKNKETALNLAENQNWPTVATALRDAAGATKKVISP